MTVAPEANTDNTSLIADLHDRIAKTARQISELDQRILEADQQQLTSADVEAAFADFAGLWDTLSPQEQARSLALAVKRVEFDSTDSSVEIEFHTEAIQALATNTTEERE
ncbi:hypothetical protein KOR42_53510 [Thalassoglobus neptunius]|uniref:Uncharacterized protein n=1 Tax=Thalassoglobus neptunius TaxID=1938619 RepID=A0A5C5VB95_9PLAN|nr:hypothetical protein KOR42_53510 [Thalassoglobus neptunius]